MVGVKEAPFYPAHNQPNAIIAIKPISMAITLKPIFKPSLAPRSHSAFTTRLASSFLTSTDTFPLRF